MNPWIVETMGQGSSVRTRSSRRWMLIFCCAVLIMGVEFRAWGQSAEGTATEAPLSAEVDSQTDAEVRRGLGQRFGQIAGFENLQVEVQAGVVRLSGTVLSQGHRDEAVKLAQRIEGVARVEDHIEVIVDPRRRLRPALEETWGRILTLVSYLPLMAISLALILLFVALAGWVGRFDFLYERLSSNRFAQDLLRQALRIAVILVGVLIALEILDATALVGAVLGTAGIFGLALGFAFRDLAENYISSILLSIRQPFAPNDYVSIDDRAGKVVRLTSRATILMTLDGNHLRIPNSQVFKGIILNYTRNPLRRFDFGVGVGVGEDLAEAQKLGIEALTAMPGVLDEPSAMALIEELGDSNVLLRFYAWVDQRQASFTKVKSEAIRHVKTVLEDAGMDLPEPIYRLHMVQSPLPGESRAGAGASAIAKRAAKESAVLPSDIKPEDHLEKQIADDRAIVGGEDDLLEPEGATE